MLQIHIKDILLIVLPILSCFLTYIFSTRKEKLDTVRKFKEEKYTNLILLLQSFVYSTVSRDGKKKFFEENYKSWLYCSDNVTRAINDFVDFISGKPGLINDTEKGHELIGKIILEMRKDLLGKTKLNISDFKYIDVI
jgi:hypothetical protein